MKFTSPRTLGKGPVTLCHPPPPPHHAVQATARGRRAEWEAKTGGGISRGRHVYPGGRPRPLQ